MGGPLGGGPPPRTQFTMGSIIPQISVGLSIASILLLVALGLAIIYGTMGVINLAHGEFVMLGAYAVWFLQITLGLNLIACLPLVFLFLALVGLLIERLLIRHLYTRPLDTILATWGVGVILQQAIRLSAGAELRYVKMPDFLTSAIHFMGYEESAYRIFIFVLAVALLAHHIPSDFSHGIWPAVAGRHAKPRHRHVASASMPDASIL